MTRHVVLIHGLARTPRYWRSLRKFLDKNDCTTSTIGYPSRTASIEQLASDYVLPFFLENNQHIDVVTHSMGGLLLRSAISQLRNQRGNAANKDAPALNLIQRIVMLGPPNAGSEITDKLGSWWLYGLLMGRHAARELRTDESATPRRLPAIPQSIDLGIIAGNRPRQFPLAWLMPGPLNSHDSKVSVASTHLPEEHAHLTLPVDHDGMLRNASVHQATLGFLRTASFDDS